MGIAAGFSALQTGTTVIRIMCCTEIRLHFKLPFPDNSAPSQHPIDLPMTQISSMHTVRETERQRETECQRETDRRETERDKDRKTETER